MHSVTTKKAALAALLVLAALLSIFAVGKRASDPAYHQASIDALEEKQETVLELTAASTAASAAITLLPGDTATPIAEKLADLSGYFLIVLCAIFLEKARADVLPQSCIGREAQERSSTERDLQNGGIP